MAMNITIDFGKQEKKLSAKQQRRADQFDRDAAVATAREVQRLEYYRMFPLLR